MSKSSKIVQAILKDIMSLIKEECESGSITIWEDNIKTDRQLFDNPTKGFDSRWIDTDNISTLKVLASVCGETPLYRSWPNVILAIAHRDIYNYSAGDVELQGQHFGNLADPGIIDKLKRHIKDKLQAEAKLGYERPYFDVLLEPGRSL